MSLSPNSTISHYRISSKLGEGGMGEVWLAKDTRLSRKVALKLLPTEFTQDPKRLQRFVQEAKAASALNHPNIVSVYDIGECDNGRFIVMEFVSGRTLRALIASDNSLETLFTLGRQLAQALSAAHAAGITHRDIKPDNIMVRDDGYVKILDFGLARLLPTSSSDPEAATLELQTTPGTVIGTLAYMSPEQASGQTVGSPSDVFALGIVLYELATGRHPFKSETMIGYLHAITSQVPPSLSSLKPHLPESLDDLIFRMLEKDASKRPSAAEVAQALGEIEKYGTSNTLPLPVITDKSPTFSSPKPTIETASSDVPDFGGRPAIAVLPFDNLSLDPEQDYFADGLAEDLITRLSLWRSFPVIARNSSFVYERKAVDIRKLSTELGVRYVVEGSVRKAGNQVRISTQLIDATTGQHVWAKSYDRELTDVFAIQDEISEAIAISLVGDLERAEHRRAQRRDPQSLEAWGLYQRALPLIYNFTREDCAQARSLLERATTLDPHFSTALARLAEVKVWEIMYEWTADPDRTVNVAIGEARRAVTLDPLDAQARAVLAFALMTAGDGNGAFKESHHAVSLNPSLPFALAIHAYHRHMRGHSPEESIGLVQRALSLSPHDPAEWLFYDVLAGAYFNAKRFAEGLEAGERLIALSPNYYWGYLWSAMNAVGLGRIEQARSMVREAQRVKPELSFELARKCLGTMAEDVERRFCQALRQAGLEEPGEAAIRADAARKNTQQQNEFAPNLSRGFTAERASPRVRNYKLPLALAAFALLSLILVITYFFFVSNTRQIDSIAVLPFVNQTGSADLEYLSDGMTETLIGSLSHLENISIKARSSVFRFKGREIDPKRIGQELSVAAVLTGRVMQRADQLTVDLELVDAKNETVIWSEHYNRQQRDVASLQNDIARDVANKLRQKLTTVHEKALEQRHTENAEAYHLYLHGRYQWNKRTKESLKLAIDYFEKAIKKDANYALAYSGLADAYTVSSTYELLPPNEAYTRARIAAQKALEIDPTLAEAYATLADTRESFDWDFEGAERDYRKAIQLAPNYSTAHQWYGELLRKLGRFDEAVAEQQRALELDPLSVAVNHSFSVTLFYARRYDEAIARLRHVIEMDEGFVQSYRQLGMCYIMKGMYGEAIAVLQKAVTLSNGGRGDLARLGYAFARSGNLREARKILAQLKERQKSEYIDSQSLAEIHFALGEKAEAFTNLQKAYQEKSSGLPYLKINPAYDEEFRSDPRFHELLTKIGLPSSK